MNNFQLIFETQQNNYLFDRFSKKSCINLLVFNENMSFEKFLMKVLLIFSVFFSRNVLKYPKKIDMKYFKQCEKSPKMFISYQQIQL